MILGLDKDTIGLDKGFKCCYLLGYWMVTKTQTIVQENLVKVNLEDNPYTLEVGGDNRWGVDYVEFY